MTIIICAIFNIAVLDKTPHGWDEASYYLQSQIIASGRLTAPGTPFPEFFWIGNFIDQPNKRFSIYPPGFTLILAVFLILKSPWMANAAFAGINVLLIFFTAKRIFGNTTALLTLPLLMLSPFFMFMGGNYLSHMSCMAFINAGLLTLLSAFDCEDKQKKIIYGLLCGFLFAYAFLIRPFSAALGLLASLSIAIILYREKWMGFWIPLTAAFFTGVAGSSIIFIYNNFTTGSPLVMGYKFSGKDFGFLGKDDFHRASVFFNLLANFPKFISALDKEAWGWLLPDMWLAVCAIFLCRKNRKSWAFLFGILIFLTGQSFYYYFDLHYGPRLVFESFGWIVILSAAGFCALFDLAAKRRFVKYGILILVSINILYGVGKSYPNFISYYSQNYCGQGGELLEIIKDKELDNAVVFLNANGAYAYANLCALNNPVLAESPVLYARYSPDRIRAMTAFYPRKEYLVLTVQYKEIPGKNEYADKFKIINYRWDKLY